MEIQRKLLKNSILGVKTYFYFLIEDGFDKNIVKLLKTLKIDNWNRICYTCKKGVLCKMPLLLLKTEKHVIYEILDRKSILKHEKVVFYKMCLNVQKG